MEYRVEVWVFEGDLAYLDEVIETDDVKVASKFYKHWKEVACTCFVKVEIRFKVTWKNR